MPSAHVASRAVPAVSVAPAAGFVNLTPACTNGRRAATKAIGSANRAMAYYGVASDCCDVPRGAAVRKDIFEHVMGRGLLVGCSRKGAQRECGWFEVYGRPLEVGVVNVELANARRSWRRLVPAAHAIALACLW